MCSIRKLIFLFTCFLVSVAVSGGHVKSWPKIRKPQQNFMRLYMEDNGNRILITTEENGKLEDCYLSGDQFSGYISKSHHGKILQMTLNLSLHQHVVYHISTRNTIVVALIITMYCIRVDELFDRYIIELALQIVNKSEVTKVSKKSMHELVEICTYAKWSGTLDSGGEEIYQKMGIASAMLIYPGTKWCGAGNVSEGYDDLGPEKETDACCREHDHCPDSIEKFGSKYGLENKSAFTKSNCECDDLFYNCLRDVNVKSSNRVGKIYFNYIRMECFKHTHPAQCKKYKGSIRPRCVEYDLDETQEPVWQWFDAREYIPLDEERIKLFGPKQDVFEYALQSESSQNTISNGHSFKNWV